MKKIGIDARLYSQTGVGTYLKNLLYHLDKTQISDTVFYVYLIENDFNKVDFISKKMVKKKADYRWHSLSEQTRFLIDLFADGLDLMHFTYFSYPVLYTKKFVATVHDATPLLYRTGRASTKNPIVYAIKHFFFRLILRTQVSMSSRIITPTHAVKKELVSIYGKQIGRKIMPIHEGVSHSIVNGTTNPKMKNRFGKFFLYVGNFYPHKNVDNLVAGFKMTKSDRRLLLVGPDDYFTSRLMRNLQKQDKVVIVKNPTVKDLIFYYKNADALVHPSYSEGFGLPIVEAAYFNCPVIASDIPVFRELLGDNYLSFDPRDKNDIALKLSNFMKHKPTFRYNGITDKFSFKKMADKTLKIYRESMA